MSILHQLICFTSSSPLSPIKSSPPSTCVLQRKERPSFHIARACISRSKCTQASPDKLSDVSYLYDHISASWDLHLDPRRQHESNMSLAHASPPILRHSRLLTYEECDSIVREQSGNTEESSLYLNYRVNKDIEENSTPHSSEAAKLIAATELSSASSLSAESLSGFRSQVSSENSILINKLLPQLHSLLGFSQHRKWIFEEGPWIRPNNSQIIIRDVTTVHYEKGEGVAPHVDGKDLTVLICLKEPNKGGGTTFTTQETTVAPKKGAGILYKSKTEMPHFAEAVEEGEKWVLQLLIDYKIRPDEMNHVDYRTGQVVA